MSFSRMFCRASTHSIRFATVFVTVNIWQNAGIRALYAKAAARCATTVLSNEQPSFLYGL